MHVGSFQKRSDSAVGRPQPPAASGCYHHTRISLPRQRSPGMQVCGPRWTSWKK
ncbi:hypothetical protein B8V81_3438 [Paenibacillus pasadenensis]|uniref:Uncharacterized protein n=1 Tax=Paenibacillus pasadenensis TaxID=217090 RepID=A0A2N5N3T9_9BACL|nr:hypothetical protein B8V81_3438 [Paenibacillus pasadenensis]